MWISFKIVYQKIIKIRCVNMKKSIRVNYIYNLIYQVVAIILPFITTPYASRVLGATNIGIYGYTISISAYFILFGSLGIALYGQREIAYEQNNRKKYSQTFIEILLLRIITMTISLLIFFLLFCIKGQYNIYFKILLLEIIANALDISWFFQGLEEFKKTVTRNLIIKIISVILIFTFVNTKKDLNIYFIIYSLSMLIGNLSLWFYLPEFITIKHIKRLNLKKHLKSTLVLFIPQIAIQVYTILDKTMLGTIITNKAEVGYYTQAEKMIKLMLTIITSLGTVMLPRIANSYAKGDSETIKIYITRAFNLVFLISIPMIIGIISVSYIFVPWFFGKGYDKVIPVMCILTPILLFIGMSNVIGMQFLLPTKKQKEYTYSVVIGAVSNFIINLILIPKLGAVGAAIGTIIAECSVTISQIVFTRKQIDYKEILKLSKNYIISSIVMLLVLLLCKTLLNTSVISMFIQIIIGIATYGICLIILKDKFIQYFLNTFKSYIKK